MCDKLEYTMDRYYLTFFALLKKKEFRTLVENGKGFCMHHFSQLLEQAEKVETCYCTPELEQRRLLLLAQVSQEPVALPVDDRPLLYRAKIALQNGNAPRCVVLLEACEEHTHTQWRYLRGEAAFQMQNYEEAIQYYPPDCYARLEACYRNLGDYKMAYEYACKQR